MEAKLIKIERKIELTANAKTELEKSFKPFIEKSLSAETRRAYGRVIKEFFRFQKYTEPTEIKPSDVIRWRDFLIENKKSAATVLLTF